MMRATCVIAFACFLHADAFVITPRTSPVRHMGPLHVQEAVRPALHHSRLCGEQERLLQSFSIPSLFSWVPSDVWLSQHLHDTQHAQTTLGELRTLLILAFLCSSVCLSGTDLGMPPSLATLVEALRSVGDDRTRFKQLLFLAAQADKMDEALKTPENKVQGCLSTVHVFAELRDDGKVYYVGDSDGQMTKGLVAILTKGLSGNSPESIQQVKPEFIHYAGLGTSLTPGRNNGFINMLKKMKLQAELVGGASEASEETAAEESASE
eukprot:scaffold510_cov242-Pinguiococcus_pyrenoidosus.AAC.6